jgi:hypothetical protein
MNTNDLTKTFGLGIDYDSNLIRENFALTTGGKGMTRYYKFTDGERTYFRASKRQYQSGWASQARSGFSGSPVPIGQYPAVEIDKAEYERLNALKAKRLAGCRFVSASDSWVLNAEAAA